MSLVLCPTNTTAMAGREVAPVQAKIDPLLHHHADVSPDRREREPIDQCYPLSVDGRDGHHAGVGLPFCEARSPSSVIGAASSMSLPSDVNTTCR
jgi:hypothetical protein